MRPLITAVLILLTFLSPLYADSGKKAAGSSTRTETVDGQVLQRTETHPETNPFPQSSGALEEEKSFPNSGRLNSYLKWTSSDPFAIGQDVAINPDGGHQFIGWNLNSVRVSFHDDLTNTPLWENISDPNTYMNFVALSANANIVANASYHNIYLFDMNTGAVTFSFTPEGNRIAGPIAVSRDGSLLVCATSSPLSGGMHRVYAFNPPSTTPIWTFDFSDALSTGIYGVNISVDNSTVAVNGKFYGWIINASNGTMRTAIEIANTESRLALSANASVLAIAELSGFIKAFNWNTAMSRYDLIWQYKVPAGTFTNWASSIDVSADGQTIMAGSLIFLSAGYDGTVYLFDTFGEGQPRWIYPNVGDMVDDVALSDDGSIGAAITWGDLANSIPDIFIFERESNVPVFTVNTPGSMFALDMSADGRSVIAGGKAVHARQLGNGGNVYNIGVDLGGGAISGMANVPGPQIPNDILIQVLGTTRSSRTDSFGRYAVSGVPAGTYTVRFSKLGYVSQTVSGVAVVTGDTTENVNATLVQTGPAPTNLVASHSLDSRIELTWMAPPSAEQRAYERLLAVDEYPTTTSRSARRPESTDQSLLPPPSGSAVLIADSVRIYRGIRLGGPYYHKWTVPGTVSNHVDSTALPLRDYYYRVTAIYGAGQSVYSNEAYGTVDSSFLQFSLVTPHRTVTPTIDGTLSPGEWTDALKVDVSDVFGNGGGTMLPRGSVFMYFKYDSLSRTLYIAGEDFLNTDGLANSEGFGLYFDDNNNNQFGQVSGNPLIREGNYWAYYFTTGSTVRFRELYNTGGVNPVVDTVFDADVAMSAATGHFTGEVGIPISFFHKNHLQVYGPSKTVGAGLFIISRDGGGNAIFHGWWPQTMTSVFTPSGFGDIKIPITLLAPPQPPTGLGVTRLGTALDLTWTDPTQGINGDPLTVPVSLELWKNGEVIQNLPLGVETFRDSNVVAEGWYEYKLRGSIDVLYAGTGQTVYYGPFSEIVGAFAVSDPILTELIYDDGIPEVFYVVDFAYNGNKFGLRYSPAQWPAKVYRVKAMTNNGNKPILVSIHADSGGIPGRQLTGQYPGESHQTAGVDSFIVTIPATDPPTITTGDFWVVLSYLPTSPDAPGIGGDYTPPIDQRTMYFTNASGWVLLPNADLIVHAFITGQTVGVDEREGLPVEFALHQNYPNPFNPSTTFSFTIPHSSFVILRVFDLLGREVATLVNQVKEPGRYTVSWDAANAASGVYFYKLVAGAYTSTQKMLLMK